jgi:hypothetical protein
MAHEIVSRCEGFGDCGLPIQVLEHEGGAPGAAGEGRGSHALFVDLRYGE